MKILVVLEKENDILFLKHMIYCVYCFENKKLCFLKAVLHIKCVEKKPRESLGLHLFLGNLHLNSASVSIADTQ